MRWSPAIEREFHSITRCTKMMLQIDYYVHGRLLLLLSFKKKKLQQQRKL